MRRNSWIIAATGGGAVIAVLAALTLFAEPLSRSLYASQLQARLGVERMQSLPEGLAVAFCGTGSPLPDPSRAQSCTAVIAGDRIYVVDAGSGAARNLVLMGLRGAQIDALLLTHYHSDHITDAYPLALQRWVDSGQRTPLPVYGPQGVRTVVDGFNAAYRPDGGYRTEHHGEIIAPPSGYGLEAIEFHGGEDAPVTVLEANGLTISAVRVNHDPASPAVAYRFDYAGRSVVVSGDLIMAASPVFPVLAEGADLMVAEALQPRLVRQITERAQTLEREDLAVITVDILDYHTTPEAAADAAQQAGSDALVLTHVVPALPSRVLHPAFLGDAPGRFTGPLRIAKDGTVVILPAGSDAVRFEDWL